MEQFPCLSDNYGYLIHDPSSGATAAIDTPDASAYLAALKRKGWTLSYILNTHHHHDHAGGNLELKRETGCKIIGPKYASHRPVLVMLSLSFTSINPPHLQLNNSSGSLLLFDCARCNHMRNSTRLPPPGRR